MLTMARDTPFSSSSKSKSTSVPPVSEKDFLKNNEEFQRNERYIQKVNRHLKELATDRHELQEEVLRRGEKIADLQKALVELQLSVFEERERFLKVSSENEELKRNEENLHESIRQLLSMTNQQDLRDKIIYILKDPKVHIGYQTQTFGKSGSAPEVTINHKLKEELDNLKHQLDEVLKISKNKSDIILDDCKQALEKSKTKIMQDEIQIKGLQKMLKEVLENNMSSVATTKGSSFERSVPIGKSVSAERHNVPTAAKDTFQKTLSAVVTGKSIPTKGQTLKNVFEVTPHEILSSATGVKSISPERLETGKAAKSLSWENQRYATAAKIIAGENPTVVQMPASSEFLTKLCSHLKDIHLSLILLQKVIVKVKDILNSTQATKTYYRTARIPRIPTDLQNCMEEDAVLQLETSLRQCTRLTFDINNMYKGLCKYVTQNRKQIQDLSSLKSEMKYFEKSIREMSVFTADNDLFNVGLRRSDFFEALIDSSFVIPEENRKTCLEDFQKIVSNCKTLSKIVPEASEFVESVIEKYTVKRDFHDIADSLRDFSYLSSEAHSEVLRDRPVLKSASDESIKQVKSRTMQDLEQLVAIYKRTAQDSESLGLPTERLTQRIKSAERILQGEDLKKCDDNFDEMIMDSNPFELDPVPSDQEEILRKINKTLSKVELLEKGRYLKDEEMCRKLAENINALTEQFKDLTKEFNVKSVQSQFSEYSKVTLSKLEELAKQCKNSVVAAEAQIAAHRSNAKHLSKKLKETEELLRESINECLSLKQKMAKSEAEYEMEKYKLINNLKEKLRRETLPGADDIIEELVANFPAYETIKSTPYICMYCRHGPGHKHCEEKIKELAAECRSFKTQLKLLKHETDQERSTLKNYREVAESSVTDLTKRNHSMQESLKALEKRNSSLLDQLKVERNRLKSMERFRHLEIEGFQTDIKQLKAKIKELEKQLLKAVLIFENNHKDIELLKTVHETALRSEQATAILRRLKAKLYQLENDIKSL